MGLNFSEDVGYFKTFAKSLERAIGRYGFDKEEDLLFRQRRQLMLLIDLEREFKEELLTLECGNAVYVSFIDYIVRTRRNVLSSRPFFRERQTTFSAHIAEAFKTRNPEGIKPYRMNYQFIGWVSRQWGAHLSPEAKDLVRRIEKARRELVETNMPLAIRHCRGFYNKTPKSHMSFMDLLQVHAVGLMSGIDKFVPPITDGMTEEESLAAYRVFRDTILGRMTGDRIESYNTTLLHFFPLDARRVYRAHKAKRFLSEDSSMDSVVAAVNLDIPTAHHVDANGIRELLAAASCVSGDVSVDPEGETTLERHEDDSASPEDRAEHNEIWSVVQEEYQRLSPREQKLMQMRGIDFAS